MAPHRDYDGDAVLQLAWPHREQSSLMQHEGALAEEILGILLWEAPLVPRGNGQICCEIILSLFARGLKPEALFARSPRRHLKVPANGPAQEF